MSKMQVVEGYRVSGRREVVAETAAEGYVKEFTRHSSDVLLNLNELRHRNILTDATLLVGTTHLRAHCAVLIACSGFFYSLYSRRVSVPGWDGHAPRGGDPAMTLSLPDSLEPTCVSLLLDFMYTSRLPLTRPTVPGVLAVATYLQMDHVADACRAFMLDSERMCATPPRSELDSRVSPACVTPQGGTLSMPRVNGRVPRPQLLAEAESRVHPADLARIPGDSLASMKPGTFLICQSRSQELKLEPESPRLGSPTPSPDSPSRSSCQPNSPAESNTCNLSNHILSETKPTPDPKACNWKTKPTSDPKACNWKKYKYIVLNPLCAVTTVKEEGPEEGQQQAVHTPTSDRMDVVQKPPGEAWPGDELSLQDRQGRASCCDVAGRVLPPVPIHLVPLEHRPTPKEPPASRRCQHPIKCESYCLPLCYSGNVGGTKPVCTGDKPYRCDVCGAQFNRPANLKTHSRIHSGEKPYRCDTCGARFVQVAHLRAHVLIHTGEKPYPCHTCGTRFRHLQTLKSHLRIHTGEKPYTCEKCDLHFRHKSQLRLHLRQKHGAVTNTKIRYKVLADPYQPIPQAC
ncbi:B-cell CLL/lymphoma 6 member B protein isoform X1 [Osmerus eperlanus]|uniref:B-cell CLL/lymphoma 6 member B protein isoform X1 n=1 Tax=Osmerus eperlanus TaxID=29151 RepID=UPI002E14AF37